MVVVEDAAVFLHQLLIHPFHHSGRQGRNLPHLRIDALLDPVVPARELLFPQPLLVVPQNLVTGIPVTREGKWSIVFAPRSDEVRVLCCHVVDTMILSEDRAQRCVARLLARRELRKQVVRLLKGSV